MTTILLLRHFHHQKYEPPPRTPQGNFELDDQGDGKVQVWVGIQVRYSTNLEMKTLGLTIKCEYWWNDDHSSKLDSWETKRTIPRTPRKCRIGWPKRQQSTSLSWHSGQVYLSRDESTRSHHQMWILVEWWPFFKARFMRNKRINPENTTREHQRNAVLDDQGATMYKSELAFSSGILI